MMSAMAFLSRKDAKTQRKDGLNRSEWKKNAHEFRHYSSLTLFKPDNRRGRRVRRPFDLLCVLGVLCSTTLNPLRLRVDRMIVEPIAGLVEQWGV
jgi:hypothetical protein